MKFYDFLIEKGKEDGIEKNVVGAVILNKKNEDFNNEQKT